MRHFSNDADANMSEAAAKPAAPRPSVLSLNINSKSALYAGYMPHLRNGGIFIPTSRGYKLGDEVFMLLSLMDDPAKLPIAGTVVWITPAGAQNSKAQGIGVRGDRRPLCSRNHGSNLRRASVLECGCALPLLVHCARTRPQPTPSLNHPRSPTIAYPKAAQQRRPPRSAARSRTKGMDLRPGPR